MKGNIGALILIALGAFVLLSNLGLIDFSLREVLATWWPLLLIMVGVALFFTPNRIGKK